MSKNQAGLEKLLLDESFLSWYLKTDVRSVLKWETWMAGDPRNRVRAEEAVAFLQALRDAASEGPTDRLTPALTKLLQRIHETEDRSRRRPLLSQRWMVAAAALLLIVATAVIREMPGRKQPEWHTAYGEVKQDILPDGSDVLVDANSQIRFARGWKDGRDRELWLTGEAFFHVAKTPMRSRFIVHVSHFDIIVTGTRFNVVNRGSKANILLKEGSVTLHADNGKELKIVPGDFVEYNNGQLLKRSVRADSLLAWKEHQWLLNGTPLKELITLMEENFGVSVITPEPATREKQLYGIIPTGNLDLLLETLRTTGDFDITREGNNITIKDHSKL